MYVLSHVRGARNNNELTLLMITHISHLAYTKIWRALSFSSDFDELQHSNRNFRSSCQWLYPSSSKTIIITKLMLLIMQNIKNKFYFEMSSNVQQDWHTRKLNTTTNYMNNLKESELTHRNMINQERKGKQNFHRIKHWNYYWYNNLRAKIWMINYYWWSQRYGYKK